LRAWIVPLIENGAPLRRDRCLAAGLIPSGPFDSGVGGYSEIAIGTSPDLIVPPFEIPPHWPRGYGLDVGWRSTAAIFGALDRASDVLYLYSEYHCTDRQSAVHAQAIRSREAWIPGVMDPLGNGRNQKDGWRLIQMYHDLGLKLEATNLIKRPILVKGSEIAMGFDEGALAALV